MPRFLVIQTAFIGDVVLATAVIEKLYQYHPDAPIDFLLRKGNESLLSNNPFINKVWVWDKKQDKLKNLWRMALAVRKKKYTHVINLHRFGTSGFITFLSGADNKIGFDKNPFAFCYTKKVKHIISQPYAADIVHEVQRNQALIDDITDGTAARPKLYPAKTDYERVAPLQGKPYICISPSSVWFTKQFPVEKWAALINSLPYEYRIYVLGGTTDKNNVQQVLQQVTHPAAHDQSGKLSFLQSTALIQGAVMNYANDSAPLHFASAVNAPVTAVYCSTVPAFGFGPLSDNSRVVEIKERLYCRPCGLHGHKACPEGHFRCALEITNEQLLWWITKKI
ncbi:MAG: glycosyltransferase family 9 protein [Taibaiella sp.]|nr:glycosyltransferase family 9 protein [Taibaiella sp.]